MSKITHLPGLREGESSRPPGKRKAKSAVTISYGSKWAVRFSAKGPQIHLGQDVRDSIQAGPRQAFGDPRQVLIDTLSLDAQTISRIDANARALGIGFADALKGEVTVNT